MSKPKNGTPPRRNGFIGSFKYNLDSKKRVCFPPDFVDLLDTQYKDEHRSVVICLSLNSSIGVFPRVNYDDFLDSLQEKSILDKNMRQLITVIQGCSTPQTLDGQKRLRLTEELCKYAGIEKEVYVKGFGDHVEIWSTECWDNFVKTTIPRLDDISDEVSKSSIKS